MQQTRRSRINLTNEMQQQAPSNMTCKKWQSHRLLGVHLQGEFNRQSCSTPTNGIHFKHRQLKHTSRNEQLKLSKKENKVWIGTQSFASLCLLFQEFFRKNLSDSNFRESISPTVFQVPIKK
jgi:hypothetical protein